MILKQGHKYLPMPHDGKVIAYIYRGGRCYYKDSPYSLAATQALRAAFPQYWTAIRDYGYAHPQLVPFVNEDPMLIVSLVEVGKTRWLVGDGKAYINSGWIPKENDFEVRTRFIYTRIATTTNMVLYANTWNEGNGLVFMHGAGNSYIQTSTSVQRNVNLGITAGADVKMSHKLSSVSTEIDGKTWTSNTNVSSINNTKPVWIMAKQNGADLIFDCLLAYWQLLFGDDTQLHLVPCYTKAQGNGMLDIVSLTFYPNANTEGAFTIEITDKE